MGALISNLKIESRTYRDQYRCFIALIEDAESGEFEAYAVNLPGVVSQGDSKEEAIANIKDAILESISSYKSHNEDIPWLREDQFEDIPQNALTLMILIDAETPRR